jgi:hypothetical protein
MSARRYTSFSSSGYSASLTVSSAPAGALAAEAAAAARPAAWRRFSLRTSCCRRCFFQASASTSSRLSPITVRLSCGRSASALAILSRLSRAAGTRPALPGANSTRLDSPPPPPNAPDRSEKGDVTAFAIRLLITFQTTLASENCGSFSEPLTGRSRSMTPFRSVSSATASFTGRLAVEPSALSPKASWLRTILLLAVSCPSGCTT